MNSYKTYILKSVLVSCIFLIGCKDEELIKQNANLTEQKVNLTKKNEALILQVENQKEQVDKLSKQNEQLKNENEISKRSIAGLDQKLDQMLNKEREKKELTEKEKEKNKNTIEEVLLYLNNENFFYAVSENKPPYVGGIGNTKYSKFAYDSATKSLTFRYESEDRYWTDFEFSDKSTIQVTAHVQDRRINLATFKGAITLEEWKQKGKVLTKVVLGPKYIIDRKWKREQDWKGSYGKGKMKHFKFEGKWDSEEATQSWPCWIIVKKDQGQRFKKAISALIKAAGGHVSSF